MNHLMKILHVIECFDRECGGPPPVVDGMCEALRQRGHEVTLFAPKSADPYVMPDSVSYKLRLFDVESKPFAISLSMMRALRDIKIFDLVHIHMVFRFPQAAAAHFARKFKVPYCIQPHGALVDYVYNNPKRRFSRHLYARTIEARNIAGSAAMIFTAKNELENAEKIGFIPPRSFIIPVGVNAAGIERDVDGGPFLKKYGLEGREVVLWMGRLTGKKALDVVVGAFKRISLVRPKAMLVLVGPDNEGLGPAVRRWVQEAGLESRVIFTGMLKGDEKRQAFRAASVFVFPSYAENFGVVMLEAMAAGCPLVISRGIDVWQEIQATGAALVVNSDAEEVADATCSILDDDARHARMGQAGREGIYRFDWSRVGGELAAAYEAMTKDARSK
jgi:glycosyltransferase involved in cell wall biosynthesis